jgi:ribosomal-protein-alanine N-acetyltransferase
LNIRLATAADIPAIQALEKQAETAAHWSDDIYRSLFVRGSVQRIVLVAEHNGSVPAFIVARVVGDEWEIENVAVDAQQRRRGIASALIHDLVERAHSENARWILLEVRQSNASARGFYRTAGFLECGRRGKYYQDPEEDAVCYRLELGPATQQKG